MTDLRYRISTMCYRFTGVLLVSASVLLTAEPDIARLKKDVEHLASDKLKGRGVGSAELEDAGKYIATQFRKLGLRPASAHGYLQAFPVRAEVNKRIDVQIEASGKSVKIGPDNLAFTQISPAKLTAVPVVKVDGAYIKGAPAKALEGKVALASMNFSTARLGTPVLTVLASEQSTRYVGLIPSVVPVLTSDARTSAPRTTVLSSDPEIVKWVAALPSGPVEGGTASGTIEAETRKFLLHNVVGVLPGSDPQLSDSYVVVSAHYDGLGEVAAGTDRIRNGANDNASGTATMLRIAELLSKQKPRPKRSIIFAAWSGEEAGGLGSRYYTRLPLIPLAKTIANVNIEQTGRHDGEGGAGPKRFLVTGLTYSDLGRILTDGAKKAGVEAYAGPAGFFSRSDNYVFAQAGVPAHTVGASLEFPDYHRVTDSAEKLDYPNMATLAGAIAQAVTEVANSASAPQWNASESATAPFRRARQLDVPTK